MPSENVDWLIVRRANGVECVLGINGKLFPVPGPQIEQYIREFDNGAFEELRAVAPKIGIENRIKIADGPLSGFFGMVTKADSRKKTRIMVDLFASCSEVELPLANVEKVAWIYIRTGDLGCSARGQKTICRASGKCIIISRYQF